MNHSAIRISRSVAVIVAGVAVGLTTTIAVAGDNGADRNPNSYQQAAQTAIANWAAGRNLSGLSPASLRSIEPTTAPNPAATRAAIAEWAAERNLSGLSPASLRSIGD